MVLDHNRINSLSSGTSVISGKQHLLSHKVEVAANVKSETTLAMQVRAVSKITADQCREMVHPLTTVSHLRQAVANVPASHKTPTQRLRASPTTRQQLTTHKHSAQSSSREMSS